MFVPVYDAIVTANEHFKGNTEGHLHAQVRLFNYFGIQ